MADIPSDFIDLNREDPKTKVLDSLRAKQQEYTKAHKPFDFRNALLDFNDYCEDHVKSSVRANSVRQSPPVFKTDWDWDSYGKADRFKLVAERPVYERNTRVGLMTPTLIGYDQDFVVKEKGGNITVFVPLADWKGKKE